MTMTASNVSELLASAETDLNLVSRSMLAADPLLMQNSQFVLEQLVTSLYRIKTAALSTGASWPPGIRVQLDKFQSKLRRLQALGEIAMLAITLRSRQCGLSDRGYTARGEEQALPALSTMAFDC
jgi:hypothetical protein